MKRAAILLIVAGGGFMSASLLFRNGIVRDDIIQTMLSQFGGEFITSSTLSYKGGDISGTAATSTQSFKRARATVFWVGESATRENGFIANEASAWDENWLAHYGGVDDPDERCGFKPCAFTPKENPFYVALPYNDLDEKGERKESAKRIPWFAGASGRKSILKNQWVEIIYNKGICYAQWEDVGPFAEDDFAYVFGDVQTPRNTQGVGAGIDLSPAVGDYLQLADTDEVEWRFVGVEDIPPGPWNETITTRGVSW